MNLPPLSCAKPNPQSAAKVRAEKYAALVREAESCGMASQLKSFRVCYLDACLAMMPPTKVLESFRDCFEAFEAARRLERTMDKV